MAGSTLQEWHWTLRQDMPLGHLVREKPIGLLKSQGESERKRVRRVNWRGKETRAQWGLERDRRAEKTTARATATVTRGDGGGDGRDGRNVRLLLPPEAAVAESLQNVKPIKCSMRKESPMIKLFAKQ